MRNSAVFTITAICFLIVIPWVFVADWLSGTAWNAKVILADLLNGILLASFTGMMFSLFFTRFARKAASARDALIHSEAKFHNLFQNASDGMLLAELDERGEIRRILDVNGVLCAQLGYSKVELLSADPNRLVFADKQLPAGVWEKLRAQGGCTFEWQAISREDRVYWFEVSARRFAFGELDAMFGIFRDITERRRSERMIRQMAYYDTVTGLPNLRLFEERFYHELHKAKSQKRKLAVIVMDIDRFRMFNDTMGRAFGDKLLKQVAGRIKGCIRSEDLLVRMDGDDFRLLLPQIEHGGEAVETAERLYQAFQDSYLIDGNEIHVTMHIGIALYPTDGEDLETLYRCANFAMYRAMEGRTPYQLYAPEMNPGVQQLIIIESDLKKAIQQRQFQMYYQPQVDLSNGEIIGMEALLRWIHPEKGMISPTQFIPVAEETGMIIPIGEWVIREVCAQHKEWRDQQIKPLPVAINLSMRQFMQPNIVEVVREELTKNEIPPEFLVLEITESMTMNAERATEMLRQFRGVGVGINLDDFGTGYSSLNHLKRFPLDKIKIDRSFVRDMLDDESDASIVSTIISLAHHLGLKVIAEGVESEEQSHFLHRQQCDEVQGFYYSPPVPAAELVKLLRVG